MEDFNLKIGILKSESPYDHLPWIDSCKKSKKVTNFQVIELFSDKWLEEICSSKFDILLLRPPGLNEFTKKLYDERVFILSKVLNFFIYPSLEEIFIYENKRFLRDWLVAQNIPHPKTTIFFDINEALHFVSNTVSFPIVAKLNIGASGNGVKFLYNDNQASDYIKRSFTKGIKLNSRPKLLKGSLYGKFKKALTLKGFLKNRLKEYKSVYSNPQKGYVIFQEYIKHSYEWRCVRIGQSFFIHKKIRRGQMASGSLVKDYSLVPITLLNFFKEITDRTNLNSVSIDIFEENGKYLVNEIQCFFGQSDPYQMLINGKPGRYIFIGNEWLFEEGMFNTNMSFDIRLEHAISLFKHSEH